MSEAIKEIPLAELHPFPDHPFGVRDDEAMAQTVESIREYGVLVPAIARHREDGGYELITKQRQKKPKYVGCYAPLGYKKSEADKHVLDSVRL